MKNTNGDGWFIKYNEQSVHKCVWIKNKRDLDIILFPENCVLKNGLNYAKPKTEEYGYNTNYLPKFLRVYCV
jgi:hypothetical protein